MTSTVSLSAAGPKPVFRRARPLTGISRAAVETWEDFRHLLGWPGALGLLCLLAAILAWANWVRGSEKTTQGLRSEIRMLREQARTAPPVVRPPDAAEQLQAFRTIFPPRGQISASLDQISRLAVERQLVLASGDYKFTEEKNLRLVRYEIHLPVRGSYTQVYGLIAAALNTMPNLALDELIIKRESRLAAEVEAQLRFSLYVSAD